jgi:hypothetical protein
MECKPCLEVVLSRHVASDPLCLPGTPTATVQPSRRRSSSATVATGRGGKSILARSAWTLAGNEIVTRQSS